MTKEFNKKRIAILPWPEKENCFLVLSGALEQKTQYGDKWYLNAHDEQVQKYHSRPNCKARITFTYKSDDVAIEWDGEYGPIQAWYKCDKDYKEGYDEARPHWLFDYAYGHGHWTQIAVDDFDLVNAFNLGNYDYIFTVLKKFHDDRKERLNNLHD